MIDPQDVTPIGYTSADGLAVRRWPTFGARGGIELYHVCDIEDRALCVDFNMMVYAQIPGTSIVEKSLSDIIPPRITRFQEALVHGGSSITAIIHRVLLSSWYVWIVRAYIIDA